MLDEMDNTNKPDELKEIELHIREVMTLLFRISRFYKEIEYFTNGLSPQNYFEFTRKYELLSYAEESMFIVIVLDLSILYKETETYSLANLFEKVKKNIDLIEKKYNFDTHLVDSWIEMLNKQEIINAVKKIVTIRNKHFAHIDKKRQELNKDLPSLFEITNLIDLAVNLVSELYLFTNGDGIFIKPIYNESGTESIISELKSKKENF